MKTLSKRHAAVCHLLVILATASVISATSSTKPQANSKHSSNNELNTDVQTSPSTTSIHQVWTSTSTGGRLDELSPEMISKLRQDVPFLAAYALRPRLVGLSNSQADSSNSAGVNSATSGQLQAPVTREAGEARLMAALQTSGSSPQRSQTSLVPQLGEFSEFNVETLSTSKSEHQHKRRTSLKRNNELNKKRRLLTTASRLVRNKKKKSGKASTKKSRKLSDKRKKQALLRSQARAGRLTRKVNRGNLLHHMNIIKHGRYSQLERQTEARDKVPVNSVEDDGVKGGPTRADKKPFYSKAANPSAQTDEESALAGEDSTAEDGKKPKEADKIDESAEDVQEMRQGDEKLSSDDQKITEVDQDDGDDQKLAASPPSPKRVGDADIDEEGDTVTVMPKSDGVDDDPDPADYEPPLDGSENDNDGSTSSSGGAGIGATTGGRSSPDPSDPNTVDGQAEDSDDDGDGRTDAQIDRDEPKNRKSSPGVEFADKDERKKSNEDGEDDQVNDEDGKSDSRRDATTSTSRDKESTTDRSGRGSETTTSKSAGDGATSDRDEEDDDEQYAPGHPSKGSRESSKHDDSVRNDHDLDYRDDEAGEKNDREISSERSSGKREHSLSRSEHRNESSTHHGQDSHCDHGSYDHHGHHDHHDHHDTIKWLKDAIPGEPNEDYPILSRANSTTNFSCRDQKYPGYYADVEARCQVFHICQADGRQDSFLCPNGTIFSQITSVCVWWNSFDCEDAPKYYKLNALLYRSSPNKHKFGDGGDKDEGNVKPMALGGGANSSVGGKRQTLVTYEGESDDEETSIDSLIRAMRRSKERREESSATSNDGDGFSGSSGRGHEANAADDAIGSTMLTKRNKVDNLGPDDEATIQRKSTYIEDDATDEDEARQAGRLVRSTSLMRHAKAQDSEPRRKRRASVKSGPPKLKSRRFARPSRRWKLRHNPKPKRRA